MDARPRWASKLGFWDVAGAPWASGDRRSRRGKGGAEDKTVLCLSPCLQRGHSLPVSERVPEGSKSAGALHEGARRSWETRCTKYLRLEPLRKQAAVTRENRNMGTHTFLFFLGSDKPHLWVARAAG